jgi:hypothetical protein
MPRQSKADFSREVMETLHETQRYWIGIERWTVTDDRGTRTFDPSLAKREIPRNPDHTGKAKGFNMEDVEMIAERMDYIKMIMRGEKPQEDSSTPF